jgi:hypothetical protein
MLKVLAHPNDFLPLYDKLKINPQKNKAMLEAIGNVKQQLENSDKYSTSMLYTCKYML